MKLLLVESPSKAKVLSKYLNMQEYEVMATYGHIREILPKAISIDVNNSFYINWQIKKQLKIDVNKYTEFILATDPDREGEAIAWHIIEVFKPKVVSRISLNSITQKSLHNALNHPRQIDMHLINAYLARITLDYLVGFSISPLLWRKLPGTKSAGRVQSAALRLIVERELEIRKFQPTEYWEISMSFDMHEAYLRSYNGFNTITDISCYDDIINQVYQLTDIVTTQKQVSPKPPFMTSTLQQSASTELGFAPDKTMSIAQSLYEGKNALCEGLITYIRTDSTTIDSDFISEIRAYITQYYGNLLSNDIREYKTKVKNAQEAHEAIRVTNLLYTPDMIREYLNEDQYKLYVLIWNRMLSSQMKNAVYESTKYIITSDKQNAIFSLNTSRLLFRGYKFYQSEEVCCILNLTLNTQIHIDKWNKVQKFTSAPSRYSDASLIKELESIGIGRPSTYARIINVLKERDYIDKNTSSLMPNNKGIIVCTFLKIFFAEYINYGFTTQMEENLDAVSNGTLNYLNLLHNFWNIFEQNIKFVYSIDILNILQQIHNALSGYLWKNKIMCCNGEMLLRTSKGFPFLSCLKCNTIYCLNTQEYVHDEIAFSYNGRHVIRKNGTYGKYLEWINDKGKHINLPDMDEQKFAIVAALPKKICQYNSYDVVLKYGRFGFYCLINKVTVSIPSSIDIHDLTEKTICTLIEKKLHKLELEGIKVKNL